MFGQMTGAIIKQKKTALSVELSLPNNTVRSLLGVSPCYKRKRKRQRGRDLSNDFRMRAFEIVLDSVQWTHKEHSKCLAAWLLKLKLRFIQLIRIQPLGCNGWRQHTQETAECTAHKVANRSGKADKRSTAGCSLSSAVNWQIHSRHTAESARLKALEILKLRKPF